MDRGSREEFLTGFVTLAVSLRPELHRYCSRLMGSVVDGEDVVQDLCSNPRCSRPVVQDSAAATLVLPDCP